MYRPDFIRSVVLVILAFFSERWASAERTRIPESTDFLLCRHCGFNIAAGSTISNVKSPAALSFQNNTLFGVDGVLIQKLRNPLGVEFDVVTARGGTCIGTAQTWQTEHTWFPGHAWKVCTCSRCSRLIGWIFEPLQTAEAQRAFASANGFYAFILDNVISEACMDTTGLTDDQIHFLAQCEADFANRYTDKDDDFSIVMAIGTARPPIMEPWRPKGGNSYRPDRSARERERSNRERGYARKAPWDGDHQAKRRR